MLWIASITLFVAAVTLRRVADSRPGLLAISRACLVVAEGLAVTLVLVLPFVLATFRIPSGSMSPTLRVGDRVVATAVTYRYRAPRIGELAIFDSPRAYSADARRHIKRVVAVEGDRVALRREEDGFRAWLVRNGAPVEEPYVHEPMAYQYPPGGGEVTVPPDSVFVLGDNRNVSVDSHVFGPVHADDLRGRALAVFWPPGRARLLAR